MKKTILALVIAAGLTSFTGSAKADVRLVANAGSFAGNGTICEYTTFGSNINASLIK